jgi:hypothetical protein
MQEAITNKDFAMKALMVRGDYLNEIESIMSRLSMTVAPEVAEIANINSKTQVYINSPPDCIEWYSKRG